MKNLTLKKVLTFSLFFLGVFGFLLWAQKSPDLSAFDSAMKQGESTAKGIRQIVFNIIYVVGAIAAVIYLFSALLGGRDGDNKVKNFSNWALAIALLALGTFLINQMFGIS